MKKKKSEHQLLIGFRELHHTVVLTGKHVWKTIMNRAKKGV